MDSYLERQKRKNQELDEKLKKDEAAFWEKLKAKLTERGISFEVDAEKPNVLRRVDGMQYIGLNLKRERPNHYGASPTGKLRFTVGDWGNKRQFMQSQSRGGDFDYNAIVDEIRDTIARNRAANATRKQNEATEATAWRLRNALVRDFFTNYEEKTDDDGEKWLAVPEGVPVRLKPSIKGLSLEVGRPMTEDELREVLAVFKKMGMLDG